MKRSLTHLDQRELGDRVLIALTLENDNTPIDSMLCILYRCTIARLAAMNAGICWFDGHHTWITWDSVDRMNEKYQSIYQGATQEPSD